MTEDRRCLVLQTIYYPGPDGVEKAAHANEIVDDIPAESIPNVVECGWVVPLWVDDRLEELKCEARLKILYERP